MDGAGIQRLFSAIREHDLQSVESLATEEPKLVNDSVFYTRTTPLHLAASLGQLEILMLLLKHGARVNAVNSRRQTPLMLACKNGRAACIGPLLDNDANVICSSLSS
jgi:ankyrin repeat protein